MRRKNTLTTTGAGKGSKLKDIVSSTTADTTPMMTAMASEPITDIRRNVAGSIERTDRFANIENGLVPYRYSSSIYGANRSSIDVRDAVVLCQKC